MFDTLKPFLVGRSKDRLILRFIFSFSPVHVCVLENNFPASVISEASALCRVSRSALTLDDEKRSLALLIIGFIRMVSADRLFLWVTSHIFTLPTSSDV